LVGNAIKFTERGEVVVEVKPEARGSGEARLHFIVRDTGVGIPADKRAAIFEAFTQADGSTTRKYGGTGLGLAIATRLVAMMGGEIWVESELGGGSTFHFTAKFGIQPSSETISLHTEPLILQGLPALVVDDNETNRRILGQMLTNWGLRVTVADSGQRALELMTEASESGRGFDLVLLDGHMPHMDGFELAKSIRNTPELAGATIMMLTSAGHRGDASRCRELGVSAYLIKPIKQSTLFDAIVSVLGGAKCSERLQTPLVTRHSVREARKRFHVLLAEDNPVNQTLAVRLLQKHGHTVVVASNGVEALRALDKESFDLVLMDVQMPEMGGFEATDHIRQREKISGTRTPIIAMTAHAMKGDRERCLAAGMDGYVAKPVKVDELLAQMEAHVTMGREAGVAVVPDSNSGGRKILDQETLLANVAGDRELLGELQGIFAAEYPKLLAEIHSAIADGSAIRLQAAAHQLKGMVSNFGCKPAWNHAQNLETLGQNGSTKGAEESVEGLEASLKELSRALDSFCNGVAQ